jgi:hypothetical protein
MIMITELHGKKAFSPKLAMKANFTHLRTDWFATNYDDKTAGLDRVNPNYDGINVYGDEVATNIRNVSDGLLAAGRITPAQYNVEVFYLILQ